MHRPLTRTFWQRPLFLVAPTRSYEGQVPVTKKPKEPTSPTLEEMGVGAGSSAFIIGLFAGVMLAQSKGPLAEMDQPTRFLYSVTDVFVDIPNPADDAFIKAWFVWICIGAALGFAAPIALHMMNRRSYARQKDRWDAEERNRLRTIEEQRERERAGREQDRRAEELRVLQSDVTSSPKLVAEHYRAALAQLETAATKLELAVGHQRRSAYTPFWEAVEAGLGALNEYRLGVERISNAVRRHESLREQVRKTPELKKLAADPIPQEITQIGRSRAGGAIADRFKEAVYNAQTDFKFASIYEQRRTTAAVIFGFSSIQDAVDRLGDVVRSGNASIVDAFRQQAGAVERGQDKSAAILGEVAQELQSSRFGSSIGREISQMNDSLKTIERRIG
jgi:hypothetical protein